MPKLSNRERKLHRIRQRACDVPRWVTNLPNRSIIPDKRQKVNVNLLNKELRNVRNCPSGSDTD